MNETGSRRPPADAHPGSLRHPAPGPDTDRFLAARERAIRLLTDGYADGRLGDAEFELRLSRLQAAHDEAGVGAAVAGLDGRAPAAVVPPASVAPGSPALPADERRLLAVACETHRTGWWEVPRLLRVRAIMSDVKLDLRGASVPPGCTIDVTAYLASVTLIVPPGTVVAFDVLPMFASATSRAIAPGRAEVPDLTVSGSSVLAEVKVVVREIHA